MSASGGLEHRLRRRMAELEANGLRRILRPPSGIDLSSNDYLGLANHPALKARLIDAVAQEGCGSTGSRLLRGDREAFVAVERRFAGFKRTEKSLYFSSGYMANLAVLTALMEPGDLVLSDEHNHASLIDGVRLSSARRVIFPHNDVDALARALADHDGAGQKFLVTESLFSMEGDEAPLADYADLCRRTGTALIVDEAHAVGVYGARGSGLIEATGVSDEVFASINTAGKALGVSGAFVAGSALVIDHLVQRARPFVFSTAPPPALAAGLDASLTVLDTEPERRGRVLALARGLREKLAAADIPVRAGSSQIVPVILGEAAHAVAVADALQAAGFDVRAIRPPTVPPGTARLRISVNVHLSEAVIDRFVAALVAALNVCAPCSAASS